MLGDLSAIFVLLSAATGIGAGAMEVGDWVQTDFQALEVTRPMGTDSAGGMLCTRLWFMRRKYSIVDTPQGQMVFYTTTHSRLPLPAPPDHDCQFAEPFPRALSLSGRNWAVEVKPSSSSVWSVSASPQHSFDAGDVEVPETGAFTSMLHFDSHHLIEQPLGEHDRLGQLTYHMEGGMLRGYESEVSRYYDAVNGSSCRRELIKSMNFGTESLVKQACELRERLLHMTGKLIGIEYVNVTEFDRILDRIFMGHGEDKFLNVHGAYLQLMLQFENTKIPAALLVVEENGKWRAARSLF